MRIRSPATGDVMGKKRAARSLRRRAASGEAVVRRSGRGRSGADGGATVRRERRNGGQRRRSHRGRPACWFAEDSQVGCGEEWERGEFRGCAGSRGSGGGGWR